MRAGRGDNAAHNRGAGNGVRMCDLPELFIEHARVARKPHKCCECRRAIDPGELYLVSKGVWSGEWSEYHTCKECDEYRAEIIEIVDPLYDEYPAFGDLADYVDGNC